MRVNGIMLATNTLLALLENRLDSQVINLLLLSGSASASAFSPPVQPTVRASVLHARETITSKIFKKKKNKRRRKRREEKARIPSGEGFPFGRIQLVSRGAQVAGFIPQ